MSIKSISIEINNQIPEDWDSVYSNLIGPVSLLQSKYWGTLILILKRGRPLFVRFYCNSLLLAQVLVIHYNVLGSKRKIQPILSLLNLNGGYLDATDGPVFFENEYKEIVFEEYVKFIEEYAKNGKIPLIRHNATNVDLDSKDSDIINRYFSTAGFKRNSWATFKICLRESIENIYERLDRSAKKGHKKAGRLGVRVLKIKDWDQYIKLFYKSYMTWARPTTVIDLEIIEEQYKIWNHDKNQDYYSFYVALDEKDSPIGVLGMYIYSRVATEICSAISPDAIERGIPVQDFLHWSLIADAKTEGCVIFDLAGVAPSPSSIKEKNIKRFKKKWGGLYQEFAKYELMDWKLRILMNIDILYKLSRNLYREK